MHHRTKEQFIIGINGVKILFMQGVDLTRSERSTGGFRLYISGSTPSIGELVNNKDNYRARVWFKNLRSGDGSPSADVERIEIIKDGAAPVTPPNRGTPRRSNF